MLLSLELSAGVASKPDKDVVFDAVEMSLGTLELSAVILGLEVELTELCSRELELVLLSPELSVGVTSKPDKAVVFDAVELSLVISKLSLVLLGL